MTDSASYANNNQFQFRHFSKPLLIHIAFLLAFSLQPWHFVSAEGSQECPANLEQGASCNGGAGDVGAAPKSALPRTTLGNPVSLVTGNKTQSEVDYSLPGAMLSFARHYSSANIDENTGLGYGWNHSYNVRLLARPDGGRLVVDATGRHVLFDAPTEGSPEASAIYPARLASDGYLIVTESGKTKKTVWTMPDGRQLTFHGSYLVRIDWPGKRFLTLYYQDRQIATVTDESDRVLSFEYTPGRVGLAGYKKEETRKHAGHLEAIILPDGSRVEYAFDERQNLTRAQFPDDSTRRYHYENTIWPSHLTGLSERTGTRFATWTYDERGRAITSSHADDAEHITIDIVAPEDTGGVVGDEGQTVVTNSQGGVSTYRWRRDPDTGASRILEARGAGCTSCPPTGRRYAYDTDGRLVSEFHLDNDGRELSEVKRTHDERGRLARIAEVLSDSDGHRIERLLEHRFYEGDSYRPRAVARPSVNPQGEHRIETTYTANGLPAQITERGFVPVFTSSSLSPELPNVFEPIERITTLDWQAGQLVAINGPRDDVDDITRFEWNAQSQLVAMHPPASPTLRFSRFDAHGRVVDFRKGKGTPIELERNLRGDIVSARHGELVVRYIRDSEGRLKEVIDEDSRRVRVSHDAAGRVASVTDDLGRVTLLEHDSESRQTRLESLGLDGATIRSIETLFDSRGRTRRTRRTIERNGDARSTSAMPRILDYQRDEAGRNLAMRDPSSGATSHLGIDLATRLMQVTRADGTVASVGFDAVGRDVRFEDARANVTHRAFDDFGRVVMTHSPDTGRAIYKHDAAGNRVEAHHESKGVMRFAYDAANRLVSRTDADGVSRWDWDAATGTLSNVTNGTTTERFEYDNDARLTRHVRQIDTLTFETGYEYDTRGRLAVKRLPDGQLLRHHYHESGPNRGSLRAIVLDRWFGLGYRTLAAEIDLDSRDGEAGHLSGSGVRTQQTFASNGDVKRIEIGGRLALGYTFDDAGRIVAVEENGEAQRYAYARGRLVAANTLSGDYFYTYDALGNRTGEMQLEVNERPQVVRHSYVESGEGNRLMVSADAVAGSTKTYTHTHNPSGAPTVAGDLVYTYNAAGRPIAVHRGAELLATYAYNAFGERVKKVAYTGSRKPIVTYFLYDGSTLVAEADEDGTVSAQYVYLEGHRPVAKLEGRDTYEIYTDHLGTPRLMTGDDGSAVWRANYTPFGRAHISLERVALPIRLPGQYEDAETGTHYNYLRDYDPQTGRYLTADPIGLAGGDNLYAYVAGSPLDATDPLGLFRFPSRGAESDALIASLTAMTAEERRTYVMTELDSFNDREKFYFWAHEVFQTKPGATQNDWFLAASQVNAGNALGGIERLGAGFIYDEETIDYLEFAGLELAAHNLDTFVTMIGGGFVYDICLISPTEAGRAAARTTMMVRYEQEALEQISADYFAGRLAGEEATVYSDINSFFNGETLRDIAASSIGASPVITGIIASEFTDRGVPFDIGNIEHRIRLGELMVEANREG